MIEVTPTLFLDEKEIELDFIRSSGPGGQNVNKVASAVQLRFNIDETRALPAEVKHRLYNIARNRINAQGILIIEAKSFRTQEQNREDAIRRLIELIRRSLQKPKRRKSTRPTQASREKRLKEKKQRGTIKRLRQNTSHE